MYWPIIGLNVRIETYTEKVHTGYSTHKPAKQPWLELYKVGHEEVEQVKEKGTDTN